MRDMDELSLGEIGRALTRLEQGQTSHGEKLDEIRAQTVQTNGFVARHEERLAAQQRIIASLQDDHGRVVWTVIGLIVTIVAGVTVAWLVGRS